MFLVTPCICRHTPAEAYSKKPGSDESENMNNTCPKHLQKKKTQTK